MARTNRIRPMSERWLREAAVRYAQQGHPGHTTFVMATWRPVPGKLTPEEARAMAEREYGPPRNANAPEDT